MQENPDQRTRKPLCGAQTRKGAPCVAPAMLNGRCRNHGGLSTGPQTARGWARTRAGYHAWRDGQQTAKRRKQEN